MREITIDEIEFSLLDSPYTGNPILCIVFPDGGEHDMINQGNVPKLIEFLQQPAPFKEVNKDRRHCILHSVADAAYAIMEHPDGLGTVQDCVDEKILTIDQMVETFRDNLVAFKGAKA